MIMGVVKGSISCAVVDTWFLKTASAVKVLPVVDRIECYMLPRLCDGTVMVNGTVCVIRG